MTIASRLYTGIAALALVLAGLTAVAPSKARAADDTTTALIAGLVITATIVTAVVVLGGNDDPQSP